MKHNGAEVLSQADAVPWHIAVLVPCRDEEALLPRCLRSIEAARRNLPAHVTSDVVLVADTCFDGTATIGRQILEDRGVVLEKCCGSVGVARAIAADLALSRYAGPLHRCWLANTDADSYVDGEWLVMQFHAAEQEIDAVAGIIDIDSFADHDAGVPQRFRDTYFLGKDGTHPHVHGANLGVRADRYLSVGGWSDLVTGEDHDLWNRLGMGGARRLSTTSLRVITSGRRVGRAPRAFAEALAAHNQDAA